MNIYDYQQNVSKYEINKFILQRNELFHFAIKYTIKRVRHIPLPAMKCSNRSLKFFGRQLWNEFHTSMITVAFIFITLFEVGSWQSNGMKCIRKKTRFDSDCRGSPQMDQFEPFEFQKRRLTRVVGEQEQRVQHVAYFQVQIIYTY